jgi:chromosome segregation ATPase
LAKQQKQATQLLNSKSELDSVKRELEQANLEIETLKMSRDSFYKKVLEVRAGMNPLYEELTRLRDETKKLQAQKEPIDVIAVRSGNEALRADNKDLKNKVMELEQQLLQRDLRVASLETRTEILQKENLDLKNGEWEIPGRKKNISIKRKKTANGEFVEPEVLEDGTLFYPVKLGKEVACE